MNPHQPAELIGGHGPLTVRNGEPSMINLLDALNAWHLVREANAATGRPAAASFKHVSPAGAAVAGDLDDTTREVWGLGLGPVDELTSAYVRARDADPKSSFGDVIAVSESVTVELAQFVQRVIADAIVAPGFADGAVEVLATKQRGRFLVLEVDPSAEPPARERRDVHGLTIEQDRDTAPINERLLGDTAEWRAGVPDALLAMATLRYTQSNSIVVTRDEMTLGIGAGQQNRVDCVRLALAKARVWWLRRHPLVRDLRRARGMTRQDRLNWQIRFAEAALTRGQRLQFAELFGAASLEHVDDQSWRTEWAAQLTDLTLASDGNLAFRDNLDYAHDGGVRTVVEPGGSIRTPEIAQAARELGMRHVATGLRLFHH